MEKNEEQKLEANVQAQLDQHLDAIDRELAESGVAYSERRAICEEVEALACELVWQRANGKPTESDMKKVLAKLDAPEAYQQTSTSPVSPKVQQTPEIHPFAMAAFVIAILGLVLLFLPFGPKREEHTIIFLGCVTLLNIGLAIAAIRNIRNEPSRYTGTTFAVFGVLFVPLLILNTLVSFNVSEINPFARTISRHNFNKKSYLSDEQHKVSLPRKGEKIQHAMQFFKLTKTEKWIVEYAPILPILIDIAIVGLSVVLSLLLFVWLTRHCRPPSVTG